MLPKTCKRNNCMPFQRKKGGGGGGVYLGNKNTVPLKKALHTIGS